MQLDKDRYAGSSVVTKETPFAGCDESFVDGVAAASVELDVQETRRLVW